MSVSLTINGTSYEYPETNDQQWGPDATQWAVAVTSGMLQKAGGLFQLLAEVDFGTAYGVKSLYYKSRTSNVADAGQIRLARADVISWRNQAGGGNLDLGVNSSDKLTFNGVSIVDGITALTGDGTATGPGSVALTLATVNSNVGSYGSASKSATITLNAKGLATAASETDIQITESQVTNLVSDLAAKISTTLTSAHILVGNGSNVATDVAMTGDITISNSGVTAIGSNKVTNAMLAQVATATFKGRTSSGTGNVEDLTTAQATALLDVMTGGGGTGLKGLVPAQVAGDVTKFLRGDATWATPPGAGDVVGPASATANAIVLFNGTTGKLVKDSALTITVSHTNRLIISTSGGVTEASAITASKALASDSNGIPVAATTTTTELNLLAGTTANVNTNVGTVSAQSASYAILDNDGFLTIDMTTGSSDRTVTLPAPANNTNRTIRVKKVDSGTGKCTVSRNSSETIDGANTFVLVDQGDFVQVQTDGTNWYIVAKGIGTQVISICRDEAGAASPYGSTNTKIRRIETSVVNTGNAITRATSSTNGNSYTINQSGFYSMYYTDRNTGGGLEVGISRNSNQLTTNVDGITNTTRIAYSQGNTAQDNPSCSATLYLASGDVIRPHGDGSANITAVDCNFMICKVGI